MCSRLKQKTAMTVRTSFSTVTENDLNVLALGNTLHNMYEPNTVCVSQRISPQITQPVI